MTRCKICPCTRNRSPVLPSGPSPCRLLFIGEGPARHEDALGIPFVGDSGKEENEHYLPLAGLDRDSVVFCNAVYCSQPTYRNPTDKEAAVCSARHLPALLDRVRPEIIVPMGAVACSLFPSININIHHGRPQVGKYADWEGIVFPTYHPAAGLRSTAYMIPLRQDMKDLKELLRRIDDGSFGWPSDPYPNVDYQIVRGWRDLEEYFMTEMYLELGPVHELATDTETLPSDTPYCLTYSHTPGTGRLIYTRDKDLICRYIDLLRMLNPLLLFHNYLFDANPYGEMGIPILPGRFLDTMVRAYELCLGGGGDEDDSGGRGSLGLKTLAYRHLNMPMRSFKDTVLPHVLPKVLDWLSASSYLMAPDKRPPTCQCLHPSYSHEPRGKTQRHTGPCQVPGCLCLKHQTLKTPKLDKTASLLSHKVENLATSLAVALMENTGDIGDIKPDPWKRVKEWNEGELETLEDLVGPFPVLDISLVPEPELLAYAVRDADATGRLNTFLNTVRLRP